MRKQAVILAMALAAAGCGRTPFPTIQTEMDSRKGKPVKSLLSELGDPSRIEEVNGERAYVWTTSAKTTVPAKAADAIGFNCVMRVFVGRDDKVRDYDFKGNVGGCAAFAHRLDNDYALVHWSPS